MNRRSLLVSFPVAAAIILGLACCRSSDAPEASAGVPLFEGLGQRSRPITTSSPEAQRYFDQGLTLMYGFNHDEAIASFRAAAERDPECAMAYWGAAVAAGPNINNTFMTDERNREAYEAVQQAVSHAGQASEVERALIDAARQRYAWPAPADRKSLDEAFAAAMRKVYEAFPGDDDVAVIFAESMMDLRPWDLWTKSGEPQPGTLEIVRVLETVLARSPRHPNAIHLYIHAVEASPDPGRALPHADRLRDLVPASGHLVHMPSHIDIRVGHYEAAAKANERAIAADLAYVARRGRTGFYNMYRAHNYHFLVYASFFEGRYETALRAARDLVKELPADAVAAMPEVLDGFLATPLHVLIRFGRFEDVLREPAPDAKLFVTTAVHHYARGVSFAALGRVAEARAEAAAFETAFAAVPDGHAFGNNPAKTVLAIGRELLQGELAYREGRHDEAFARLRKAVEQDDALRYDEPWGWMQPVRHALGALLLEQGRLEEAEATYRADLARHPNNGWAIHGLAEVLRRTGRTDEARSAEDAFQKAWARADVAITASCACRRGT